MQQSNVISRSISVDPVTKYLGKFVLKHGKEKLKALLKDSLAETAANATATAFHGKEVREALITWSTSDEFLDLFGRMKAGDTLRVEHLGTELIKTTGFFDGEDTEVTARCIVIQFLQKVE